METVADPLAGSPGDPPVSPLAATIAALSEPPEPKMPDQTLGEGLTGSDIFAVLDDLDAKQVVSELSGQKQAVAEALVYRFELNGKTVTGLSKRGVDECVRLIAETGQCFREAKLRTKESDQHIDAFALVERVVVDKNTGREVVLERKYGTKRQAKIERVYNYRRKQMETREDRFVLEKACSKALRNALSRLLPEELKSDMIEKVLALMPEKVADVTPTGRKAEPPPPPPPESSIDPKLVQLIQIGFKENGIEEAERRSLLQRQYGVSSVLDLNNERAQDCLNNLRTMYRARHGGVNP